MSDWFKVDKIFDIFNVILLFFVLNLLFMLANIPSIVFLLTLGLSQIFNYFPLFLLCLLPVGPAFTVLLYCMGQFMKHKTLTYSVDLPKGIKLNAKQSFIFWTAELGIIFMLFSNIMFFSSKAHSLLFTCISISLGVLLLAVSPYIYLLISRFSMPLLEVLKSAIVLAITRPLLTLTNILLFALLLIFFEIAPGTVILFSSSLFAYALQFANRALMGQLEKQASKIGA